MKDLTVFIIGKQNRINISYDNLLLSDAFTSISNQLKQVSIEAELISLNKVEDLPNMVDSKLVVLLSSYHIIPDDYIFNISSLNNIFRDTAIFFGPVITVSNDQSFQSAIKDHYYKYDLDIEGLLLADITEEPYNYGDLIGSVISGNAYNEFNYSPIKTPRGYCANNQSFLKRVSKKYRILYSSSLYKIRQLTQIDFEPSVIGQYYYDKGYEEGLKLTLANTYSKKDEIWKTFIESPELTDYEMPKWLHKEKDNISIEYLENLLILKFQYQLGLFEGMLNKKLI